MSNFRIMDLTPGNIGYWGVCGYKDAKKHKELQNKIDWFNKLSDNGLKIKIAVSESDEYLGMVEFMPGELAHRPVDAAGYLFIQCIFLGFKKEYKGKGIGSALVQACVQEAKDSGMKGVASVARKSSFMASEDIFLKNGFSVVEKIKPDFSLVAMKFDVEFPDPSFKADMDLRLKDYPVGLTILRSAQCPYTEKNVNAILDTARKKFNLDVKLVDLTSTVSVQNSPCAFGTFAIIYEGKIISHHPISNTRFENIINGLKIKN